MISIFLIGCMTVVTAVTITKQPVTTSVIIGSSLHLDCATDTPVNITWYAKGKELNCIESCIVFNNNTLFINKTSIADTGSYYCTVKDEAEVIKSDTVNVTVQYSCKYGWKCPNSKKCISSYQHCNNEDNCGDLSDETVNCSAPGEITSFNGRQKNYNSIKVSWRRDSRAIQYNLEFKDGGNVTTFVVKNARSKLITNLSNGTTYQFRVSAQNFVGETKKTKWINVTIPRVVPPSPVRNLTVVPFSVSYTYVKMDVQFLRPIESGSLHLVYYLRICHYNVTTKARVGCIDKNTYITSYYTKSMRPESVYIVSVYAENKAMQRGPKVEHVFTTPAYKKRPKPQSSRSGLSDVAIAGIVVACLSAFTAIMGFLCKVCCSESDEEVDENIALNGK
ncbi:uncharacterized protein LOC130635725 isoform X2 [Hydractinia symbiolongicarpus]|nr:uncharacterized protein LOC130635725 isoform X2 [Hydractinia symbiolongicarpus]XP_057301157.1 uncharacterized protein LOC130635725 isoform X2 [Hydractinia symbiolongicarpus]XP_057301159.1 uncharacterized protein LOC130635725 isoform X2 [Hydractinia symbiolongicarpus]